MKAFALNIVVALVWASTIGPFTPGNVLAGFLIGYFVLWLLRKQLKTRYTSRAFQMLKLILLFLYELWLSAFRVAIDVLSPRMTFRPGIVGLPLASDDDVQITVLANLITLTPGTLSMDVSTDKSVLYVHAMRADDPEGLKQSIKSGFEAQIKEALD